MSLFPDCFARLNNSPSAIYKRNQISLRLYRHKIEQISGPYQLAYTPPQFSFVDTIIRLTLLFSIPNRVILFPLFIVIYRYYYL